jgi:chromosome segregation ATPase
MYQEARDKHSEELSRKNEEIRDLSALNDETLKTANEATFCEKKFKQKIKKLSDELTELRREHDHKERCFAKI